MIGARLLAKKFKSRGAVAEQIQISRATPPILSMVTVSAYLSRWVFRNTNNTMIAPTIPYRRDGI